MYVPDITYGETLVRRGIGKIDCRPSIRIWRLSTLPRFDSGTEPPREHVLRAVALATGRPRASLLNARTIRRGASAGEPVALTVAIQAEAPTVVKLHYRRPGTYSQS